MSLRLLRDHFFTLFVLAPIIMAGFFYTIYPGVEMIEGVIAGSGWLWGVAIVGWTLLFLPSAINEVAPTRTADAYLDALPISNSDRLFSGFVAQAARNAIAVAVLLAGVLSDSLLRPEPYLFAVVAAGVQLLLSAALARRRGRSEHVASRRRVSRLRLPKRLGQVRPQLLRDLLLTLRMFSPAVPFAIAGAATALALAWSLRTSAGDRWTAEILLAGCGVATMALSSLAPLLLRFQLPLFWLEQSAPIEPDSIWRTKVWFGAIVSVASLLISLPMLATVQTENLAVLAAQALVVTLTISSTIVLLMFEVIDRPLLGLILAWLMGSGLAGLYVLFWEYLLITAVLHFYVVRELASRAQVTASRVGGPPL